MEIDKIKIFKTIETRHFVRKYKNWQYKICDLIGVEPRSHFWVEMTIYPEGISKIHPGIVIRFED